MFLDSGEVPGGGSTTPRQVGSSGVLGRRAYRLA
eukprot:COSAG03_NODE_459_length_7747_cov_410.433708_10_plen_34_part_00